MRSLVGRALGFLIALPVLCLAQNWELGGAGGYGFYRNLTVTKGSASGTAGFDSGVAFSAVGGQHPFRYLSGELRYVYRQNDPMVKSGSTSFSFAGDSHIVHYDALVNLKERGSSLRPYFAFGGGIKFYRGLGQETPSQPLDSLAVLTKTSELLPLLSVGGGVSYRLTSHTALRFDFRDYITPFPSKVVTPAPGATLKGWMHDFTPMVGISAMF